MAAAAPSPSSSPSTSGPTDWEVSFTLPETFDCEKLENSPSIVFDALGDVKTKTHKIKGFTVTVTAQNEDEMLEMANTQAERLTQIMSVKALGHVKYAYHGFSPKNPSPSGSKSVRTSMTAVSHRRGMINELNLNSNQRISNIMQNDEDTNILLYHARLAIEAEENRQYANMYRELFQIIEKETGLPCYKKFKSLRAAISHQREVSRAENDVITHFGAGYYDFTTNHEFDHNSRKNREHLKIDADNLKKVAIAYIIAKLR
jgi:hypothetical protein